MSELVNCLWKNFISELLWRSLEMCERLVLGVRRREGMLVSREECLWFQSEDVAFAECKALSGVS